MIIHQLRAMIIYGFLDNWRRGNLRFLLALYILMPLLVTVIIASILPQLEDGASLWSSRYDDVSRYTGMAIYTTIPLSILVFLILPLFTADTIPLDTHFLMRDYWDTLPVSGWVYLTGKLLSVWAGLFLVSNISMAINGMIFHLLIGAFQLSIWLIAWYGGVIPMSLLMCGLALLLNAGFRLRRNALFFTIATIPVSVFIYSISPIMRLLFAAAAPTEFFIYDTTGQIMGIQGFDILYLVSTGSTIAFAILGAAIVAWYWSRRLEQYA